MTKIFNVFTFTDRRIRGSLTRESFFPLSIFLIIAGNVSIVGTNDSEASMDGEKENS